MDDIYGMVILILSIWLFFTVKRQTLFQRRLNATRQKTAGGKTGKFGALTEGLKSNRFLVPSIISCSLMQNKKCV